MKLNSSQNQDGKNKGSDMKKKKKMKKSRLIKVSNVEAVQSQTLQKHRHLVRKRDDSPNYMKPTKSSDAKKELFQVSLQNIQSRKNLQQKCSSSSKANLAVSCKKPEKSLTRLCSFKASRTCPRKSSASILCADMNSPMRHTCSSTLKDSKFPSYLMLDPGGTESEGISVMNVCPYRYCSLNGHHHPPLPPLKSFVSAKRRSMKMKPLSPRKLKMLCETEDTDIDQNVLDGKHAQEIGVDFFVEIYVKGNEGEDEMAKFDSAKDLDDQDDIEFATDEDGIAGEEDGVKQVTSTMTYALTKCEIDLVKDFKNYFDAPAIEADSKESFLQEQNVEDAGESHSTSLFYEEICIGSSCSDVSYDGERMENIELDGSDSQDADMKQEEEEQFCSFDYKENIDPSVFTEETEFNSSHDVSVMWLGDIHCNHHDDILVEEALHEANGGENTCFEAQPHCTNSVLEGASESMEFETQEIDYLSNGMSFDQSPATEEVLQHLMSAEDNDGETEKCVDDEVFCTTTKVHDEEMVETCEVDENHKESNDDEIGQENQVHSSDASVESNILVQEQKSLEEDQGKASEFPSTGCVGGEYQNTSKSWQRTNKRKRPVHDDDETRRINPRKPKLLPLVPESEPEKVSLKHQMMDERRNAEEWMLDFALRQAITKLAPARKRKVALLVEAFETVMPIPKCERHMRSNSPFALARPMQACS